MKFLILFLIFLGEAIGVYLEIDLASKFKVNGSFGDILRYVLILSPVLILCLVLLLFGYIYGYRNFQKIWVVTIISWSSIVVVETFLNYLILHEIPKGRTLIGGILAIPAIVISAV